MDRLNLNDQQIVDALLHRDALITREFLYKKCYPLFKAVYDKYYTDCEDCVEFINEIYVYIMFPQKKTGISKLGAFGFRCSLLLWLKIVVENYCRQLYARRVEIDRNLDINTDRINRNDESLMVDNLNFDMEDVDRIIGMMPNQRYRRLIKYRYVEEKTNEETAGLLGLSMDNYYNSHKRAKDQFCSMLRKESLK